MEVPVRVPAMDQIDLFENYLYLIGILETIQLCRNYYIYLITLCKFFVLRIVT